MQGLHIPPEQEYGFQLPTLPPPQIPGGFILPAGQPQPQPPQPQLRQLGLFDPLRIVQQASGGGNPDLSRSLAAAGIAAASLPALFQHQHQPQPQQMPPPPGMMYHPQHYYYPYQQQQYMQPIDTSEQVRAKKRIYRHESFPEKLHRMLEETEELGRDDIVSFTAEGNAFEIHQPEAFVKEIVPKYFRHNKLTSFRRQLSMYGFRRMRGGQEPPAYTHELFLRGRPELCKQMVRVNELSPYEQEMHQRKPPPQPR